MKVVINSCYGGFGLSRLAQKLYCVAHNIETGPWDEHWKMFPLFNPYGIDRSDPALVTIVETLKDEADGMHAKLKVVDIPDDVDWYVDEHDGKEWVAEKHRTWS